MPHNDITFHHQLHALFVSSGKALFFSISLSLRLHPIFRTISKQLSASTYIDIYIYICLIFCVSKFLSVAEERGMGRRRSSAVSDLFGWVRRQSMRVKISLIAVLALCALITFKFTIKDHNYFFIASEAVHAAGIIVLIYKLTTKKTCSGLSLRSQELTALSVATRLVCSTLIEGDIHTVLDFTTLMATTWVMYMIRFKLKSTYIKELDNLALYYVVVPCAILAILLHPYTIHFHLTRVLWAFGVYLESVSVLPQLRLMQNAKMIEPFTAHYVFALGVARFLSCAHWIIQIYETRGKYLFLFGNGYFWFLAAFLAEVVQTFILADFCYYYIKCFMQGQLIVKMPV